MQRPVLPPPPQGPVPAPPVPVLPLYQNYLEHACSGVSLRALARAEGVHPSTMLRRVRRVEEAREDPLLDGALNRFATPPRQEALTMTMMPRETVMSPPPAGGANRLSREGLRVLRRLGEPGARLAVAPEMEKAVVLRRLPDGRELRTAILATSLAQDLVMRDWISCRATGRVALYELTLAGRAALRRQIALEEGLAEGMAEAQSPFAAQHREWGGAQGGRRARRAAGAAAAGESGRKPGGAPWAAARQRGPAVFIARTDRCGRAPARGF